jgi:hypothetical protein
LRGLSPQKADLVDEAYNHLLDRIGKVSPELTELLRKKYEDERQAFAKAAQDATPSQDPAYWAKSSCSKCYGRGILGKRHLFMPGTAAQSLCDSDGVKTMNSVTTVDVQCKCTTKSYQAWLVEFRTRYNVDVTAKEAGERENAA